MNLLTKVDAGQALSRADIKVTSYHKQVFRFYRVAQKSKPL